jgi:hypothetical protein
MYSTHLNYNTTSTAPDWFRLGELTRSLFSTDLFSVAITVNVKNATTPEVITMVEEILNRKRKSCLKRSEFIELVYEDCVIAICDFRQMDDAFVKTTKRIRIYMYGSLATIQSIHPLFSHLIASNESSVYWSYSVNGQLESTRIPFEENDVMYDEFYPWIRQGVAAFEKQFLESSSNILLMIGEAGCGKSSLIRDMITRNKLATSITYDEDVMRMDRFFVQFITGDRDLLVVEDADVFIKDRSSGNRLMNKLLNASDGLIKTKKKIVFTANLTHLDEGDSALIRPGRCFESLIFRELTHTEAKIAARVADLPEPDGPRTLAQLFNSGPTQQPKSRLGFV